MTFLFLYTIGNTVWPWHMQGHSGLCINYPARNTWGIAKGPNRFFDVNIWIMPICNLDFDSIAALATFGPYHNFQSASARARRQGPGVLSIAEGSANIK